MKKGLILLSVFILGLLIISEAQKKKVLFLGNSYTASYSLPSMFSQLALSLGDTVSYDSNTPGGTRLMDHASNATSLSKIRSENWDFVVLQAQSQEPSWPPSQISVEVYPYAIQLNDSIKANNACTETVFFMTWGRKNGDSYNCASWPPVCTYLGMQERLMVGYLTMAELTSSTVAPCGMTWMNSMQSNPTLELYSTDNSHPVEAGTYLNACVMYATMFQKSPVGATYYGNLTQADAEFLQHIADSTVLSDTYQYYFEDSVTTDTFNLDWQSWFNKGNIVFADFDYTEISPGNIEFTDMSLNCDTYDWNFGDGGSSSMANPIYAYTASSNYTVTQHVSNSCFSDSATQIINIIVNIDELKDDEVLKIYPNPGNGIVNIELANEPDYSVSVIDLNGKVIISEKNYSGILKFDLRNMEKGTYILQIETQRNSYNKQLIIK